MQLELQLAQVNLYTRKDFKSSGIGSLYEKQFLILNELKTSLMLKLSLQNFLQSFKSLFLIWCHYEKSDIENIKSNLIKNAYPP